MSQLVPNTKQDLIFCHSIARNPEASFTLKSYVSWMRNHSNTSTKNINNWSPYCSAGLFDTNVCTRKITVDTQQKKNASDRLGDN